MMLDPGLETRLSGFDAGDLGPHAAALMDEMRRAVRAGLPLSALLLAVAAVIIWRFRQTYTIWRGS